MLIMVRVLIRVICFLEKRYRRAMSREAFKLFQSSVEIQKKLRLLSAPDTNQAL